MDFEASVSNGFALWVASGFRISWIIEDRPLSGQRLNLFTKYKKNNLRSKTQCHFDKSLMNNEIK